MSSPSFAPPISRRSKWPPPALLVFSEHRHSITRLESEGFENFALRIHPAGQPALDSIDRQCRNAGPPRQLRLRQHLLQAKLPQIVLARLGFPPGLVLVPRLPRLLIDLAARSRRFGRTVLPLLVLSRFRLGDVLVLVHFHMNRAAVRNGSLWSRPPPNVNKICSKIKHN